MKRTTKPERAPQERAAHGKLIATYFEVYERCTGTKPPFGSRDGAAAWALLDALGLERAEQCLRNAFSDEWGKRRSIRSVADDPAKFATIGPAKTAVVAGNQGRLMTPADQRTTAQLERVRMLEEQERAEAQRQAGAAP